MPEPHTSRTEINTSPQYLDPIIQRFLILEGRKYDSFKLNTSFAYDTRNAGIFPDRGVLQRIQATVAGARRRSSVLQIKLRCASLYAFN